MATKDQSVELYKNLMSFRRSVPSSRGHVAKGTGSHKFAIGQTLLFSPGMFADITGAGSYRVVGLLPTDGIDLQYRLKHLVSGQERVVRESQVSAV